jgi:transcriptional regulator with XRE-family HTH domain
VSPICHLALKAKKPKPAGYPTAPRTLGEHIRQRRMDLGLFQKDLADRIGSDTTTITNWEKGRSEPEIRFLPAILGFLGYDPCPKQQSFGARLVRYRQKFGWSQKRLAAELRVDPTTLSRWETGKKQPWGDYSRRIGELFGGVQTHEVLPVLRGRI